jgi:starch phosphorylase
MNINKDSYSIAYLSMEIALDNNIKTYAGGLGVLAGDILRSAATKEFPLVGVTLISNQGYFKQKITSSGDQLELIDVDYDFSLLKKLDTEIFVDIGRDKVKVGVWQYVIKGKNGFRIPVYLLDTNISGNKPIYKKLSTKLYGGDLLFRLRQEIILGRGGVKMLKSLGYNIRKYHLNEGHGAFTAVELFNSSLAKNIAAKVSAVKKLCIFTTHTPVQTIFDEFPVDMLASNQSDFPFNLRKLIKNKKVNTIDLAMYFSGYINGVSKAHQKFLNNVYPEYNIKAITNGVNSVFWSAPEFKKLYDKYLSGWREDGGILKKANKISDSEIWQAHQKAKRRLLKYIKETEKISWPENILTICFARRFTQYKQPLLLFADVERLQEILKTGGQVQIILAGKAHFRDMTGRDSIKRIYFIKKKYPKLNIIFLPNYDLELAKLLVAGSDLWLNNPQIPQEACGTSGMKAAHNGIPQVSTLDGWWPEGYKKNKTGWAINNADDLYETLKKEILPAYYKKPKKWRAMMKNTISANAAYFNTDRVLQQYIKASYK